jgi:hypothetical protein
MQKEIFSSERYFAFYDFVVSHGQLLMRSDKRKGYENNIDIIFFDTTYVQLFAMLNGISIKKIDKNENLKYNSLDKYLSNNNSNIFEIESGGEKYYIACSFVRIFENNLEFSETSIGTENKGHEREIANSL